MIFMKKKAISLLVLATTICFTNAKAQTKPFTRGTFDRVGVNVGVGTEGVSLSVASVYTNFLEVSMGLNIMPNVNINSEIDVNQISTQPGEGYTFSERIMAQGSFRRTTLDVKANCYPFGGNSLFFVSAGFSFGGATLAELTGFSEKVVNEIRNNPNLEGRFVAEVDKYNIKFENDGNVKGSFRVKGFRPYVGLGVGRMVPKRRVGVRFEVGCQFMGSVKVYQSNTQLSIDEMAKGGGDFSDIVEKINLYPVLKLGISTRVL